MKDFREKYFGKMPDGFACQGYDTAEVIVRALKAVNGNTQDKDKLVDAIAKVEFDSPRGRFKFDPKTHNVIQPFIYVREVREVYGGLNNVVDRPRRQRGRSRHRLHAPGLIEENAAPRMPADLFAQALNGLAYGVLLFLLSVGLTLIFGMLDVVNLAHGSFYMLGAYAGLSLIAGTGNFWLALLVAPLAVGLIGVVVEVSCLRPLYRRPPLDQVLLTFGFIYLLEDLVKWIWGGRIRSIPPPDLFSGSVSVWGAIIPSYRLFVIVFGLVMAVLLWLLIERTRLGAIIRAGVFDAEMTGGLGINIRRVFTMVFAFGAALGGLSGVIAGPIQSAYPSMGVAILIPALIVVVVGGLGSLKGSLVGSLIIGQAETFGKAWLPDAAMLIIYVVMATVMLLRPQGLFGRPLK